MMDGKRKPVLARKPSVMIAVGLPKPDLKEKVADKLEESPEETPTEGLSCPKCGMTLADTPENREYAASRAEEADADDEADDEDA